MATSEPPTLESVSGPMRRVLDALLDDAPAPPEAWESLTDEEREEVAALARTANLTALTLHRPDPDPDAAEKALQRAEKALERRASVAPASPIEPPQETKRHWWERLLKRGG